MSHFYRFEEFTVDADQKVLLRNERPLALPPKVFDTLLILVRSSGRIVEKEELISQIWPETFVEESNLTVNIQQLRKVLGDNARQPRFIETVSRRGYRFIAEVKENSPTLAAAEIELSRTSSQPAPRRPYLSIAAITAFVLASVVVLLWFAQSRNAYSASSVPILSTPFKSHKFATGVVRAAITPDGKHVAYTSESGNKQSIWLRQLETSENIQIVPPSNDRYSGLAISHDGNSLYFSRGPEADQAIYRVMTFGGIPAKIVGKTEGLISVSPDDQQLSFIRCKYEDDDFCSLIVIDANGQNERKLLTRKRPIRMSDNQFSPDGKSIAVAVGQSWNGGSDFRLMNVDVASGVEHEISPRTFFEIKYLRWLPGGDALLLSARENHDGRLRIWLVSATTGAVRALTNDATDYISLSLDKAAAKMVATYGYNTFHLYLAKLDDLNNPKNLTTARSGFAFAPDGKLVYEANDGDIWTINQDGSEQRQLTNNPFFDILPLVSRDGRYIFLTSNRSGSNQVWRMNADGSNQIQITKSVGGYTRFVTPDGKWVYFESGLQQTLWRVSTDGGEETQISGPGSAFAFSPDGQFVSYYFRSKESANRFRLAVMSLESRKISKTFNLADQESRGGLIAWAPDNKSFYYIASDGSRNYLWQQTLDEKNPRHVGDLGDEVVVHLAVSPDGTNLAFIRGRWMNDAVLIEGLK
jgi:Tol biopolymer transport system component/DNA-binding winged helix-turn-helix (wHTH) protein